MNSPDSEMLQRLGEVAAGQPKEPDLVLFLGRKDGQLIDNVKYCYLETVRRKYNFRSLYHAPAPSMQNLLAGQGAPFMKELEFDLISRVGLVVCDDFYWRSTVLEYMTQGAGIFQLWHGIPLKAIGLAQTGVAHPNMTAERKEWLEFAYSGYDYVLSTSEYTSREIFSRVFGPARFLNLGYPRNDVLLKPFHKLDKLDMLNVPVEIFARLQAHRKKGGRVAAYLPTFRDYYDEEGMRDGLLLDLQALSSFGAKNNTIFLIKLHPYIKMELAPFPGNCLVCPAWADVYPLLRLADVLITDYSSVYFDYLLLDRPIHFFAPDLDEYTSKDRNFMLPPQEWMPGNITGDAADFFAQLESSLQSGTDNHEPDRERVRTLLFDSKAGNAACLCCEAIENIVKA